LVNAWPILTFEVDRASRGLRIDQCIALRVPELSRSRIQALLETGAITLDGRSVKASRRVVGGESIEVALPPLKDAVPRPQDLPIAVVYQDADIVVIDKAAGMVVHPGAGHSDGTVVNAVLHHVKDLRGIGDTVRPGIVHRLDKDTSGLLVIAKHDAALRALQHAFKEREISKTYLAIVVGLPPERGTFRTLYARHPHHRLRFTSRTKTGKEAVTHFRVKRTLGDCSLVEVRLETGRTHQIRAHFSDAGFSLVSDALYGTKTSMRRDIIPRQALHAWKLSFKHPITGKRLRFTAKIPADFRAAQRLLLKGRQSRGSAGVS
jgi:23S rRNA pseudouridine1911/1915/1917 synthase